jgi:hypothetical protein
MIRLLRIEARHNPAPLVLPLLGMLLWITPLAQDLTPVALWLDRSVDVEGSIQLIGPFAAAAAAWTASREHRRDIGDLRASTSRNPWSVAAAAWLVSLGWMVAFYLTLCAVFLSVTATQATWGSPQWWPVIDGLVALIMFSAVGFAVGLWWRARFVTPLVAVGTLAVILGIRSATPGDRGAGIGLLSPIYPAFGLNASVFYQPQPDLSMLKMVCYLGVLGIALGSTAWYFHADRPPLRQAGAALLAAGLALTATAGGLDATARTDSHGVIVPAFHDAAADHAVAYTPVCSRTPLPVCLHPAYDGGSEMTVLATIINKIIVPVLGVPGMPSRVTQVPDIKISLGGIQGDPPILAIPPFIIHGTTLQPASFAMFFADSVALSLFVPARSPLVNASPAQRALALYLIRQAHDTADPHLIPPDPAVTAAATRFAALNSGARTAWLTTHLTALRSGYITPADIP